MSVTTNMIIGQVKQYIIPIQQQSNYEKTIEFNTTEASENVLSYQIGVSIDEKVFMALSQSQENDNEGFQIIIEYVSGDETRTEAITTNNIIKMGRTFIYEPGDSLTINTITLKYNNSVNIYKAGSFINENIENIGNIYLDIIALKRNTKTQSDYIIEEEEA